MECEGAISGGEGNAGSGSGPAGGAVPARQGRRAGEFPGLAMGSTGTGDSVSLRSGRRVSPPPETTPSICSTVSPAMSASNGQATSAPSSSNARRTRCSIALPGGHSGVSLRQIPSQSPRSPGQSNDRARAMYSADDAIPSDPCSWVPAMRSHVGGIPFPGTIGFRRSRSSATSGPYGSAYSNSDFSAAPLPPDSPSPSFFLGGGASMLRIRRQRTRMMPRTTSTCSAMSS